VGSTRAGWRLWFDDAVSRPDRSEARPIGHRVLAVALTLTVLLAGFGGWSLNHSYQQNRTNARENLERTVTLAGSLGTTLVQSIMQALAVAAGAPPFTAADVPAIEGYMVNARPALAFVGNVFWSDATGTVRARVEAPGDSPNPSDGVVTIADRTYFASAMQGHFAVSSLLEGRATGSRIVIFGAPTRDGAGAVNGVLAASILVDRITPDMLESLFGTDKLTVLDDEGNVILGSDPPAARKANLAKLPAEEDRGILTDQPDVEGDQGVVAWARVPLANWTMLVERPDREVYGAARRQFLNASMVLGVIVAAALLGSLWASRRLNRDHMRVVSGQKLLSTVLEQLPASVVVVDADARSRMVNPSAGELLRSVGRTGEIGSDDATQLLEPLRHALAEGTVSQHVDVALGEGDDARVLDVSAAPIVSKGRITAASVVFEDVTAARMAERRSQEMAAALAALASADWPEQVGDIVVGQGTAALGACDAAILLLEEGGDLSPLAARHDVELWRSSRHPAVPICRATVQTEHTQSTVLARRDARGAAQWVTLPLHSAGRLSGVLAIAFPAEHALAPERTFRLGGFAAQVALALDRAQRRRIEHDIALRLQRSLLEPVEAGSVPLDVACRYVPAESHLQVGGDLYDVVMAPDGVVLLTIGDIVGHGLTAASAMGQLRSAIRTLAAGTSSPAQVLDGLDRGVGMMPACWMATVALVAYEPSTGALTYASAGHPHPLLRCGGGDVVRLDGAAGPPLGLADEPRTEVKLETDGPAMLFLYTDGLVERRGETIDDGMARAVATIGAVRGASAAEVADQVLEAQTATGDHRDDVALICASLPGRP